MKTEKIRSLRIPNFGFSLQSPAMAANGKFRWLQSAILRLVFFILTAPELGTEYRRESRRYFYPASQDVSFFSQSNFGLANYMSPNLGGHLYFQRRCVTKRNIPHPQSPTPQFRENLYFQPPQIWGRLYF